MWGEGFAAHGVEEHLLRGVDPVSGGFVGGGVALGVCGARGGSVWEGARDGADFAVGGEAEGGEDGFGWGGGGLIEGGGVAGLLDGGGL